MCKVELLKVSKIKVEMPPSIIAIVHSKAISAKKDLLTIAAEQAIINLKCFKTIVSPAE